MSFFEAMTTAYEALDKVIPARIRTPLVACGALIGVIMTWVLATGEIPALFSGFARADQLSSLQSDNNRHWMYEAKGHVYDLLTKRCRTTDRNLRSSYLNDIDYYEGEYRRLAGEDLKEPACEDLPP
jgi:hypothetical protein